MWISLVIHPGGVEEITHLVTPGVDIPLSSPEILCDRKTCVVTTDCSLELWPYTNRVSLIGKIHEIKDVKQ